MNYGEYMTDESHDLEFDREVRYQNWRIWIYDGLWSVQANLWFLRV